MSAGLHTLLAGAIDYAGMFPPARLPLEEALRNYAHYRAGPDGWMLGRFVCPASRLEELTPLLPELFQTGPPLLISALGRGDGSAQEFNDGLRADLRAIAAFTGLHGARVQVDVLETRLPPLAGLRPHLLRNMAVDVLTPACATIETSVRTFMTPFYEIGFEADWRQSVNEVLGAVMTVTTGSGMAGNILCLPAGIKLRCGGLEASAFPTSEQVAFVLKRCRDFTIPLKATAGLHHPIRRFDPGVQVAMHGFLNLFCAGVLTHARHLSEEQIRSILEDEDAGHFAFDDEGLRWQDLQATTSEIAAARENAVNSFGSCSFDEPHAGLRALGWLK